MGIEKMDIGTPRGQRLQALIDDARASLNTAFSSIEIKRRFEDSAALQMANRLYEGVDLTVVHAAEIIMEPYCGDVWAWIQARIRSGNFRGINVGGYIPFEADGHTVIAEVAGINTYKGYGDVANAVGNHIDFISRDCWNEPIPWNRVAYNNGIAAQPTPFLASNIFHWLNGLQGSVPNNATVTMTQNPTPAGALTAVDFTVTGLLPRLPAELRAVIVQKRELMPRRYSAGLLLANSNYHDWRDGGFLWLPSEFEMYGAGIWGDADSPNQGDDKRNAAQYPLFVANTSKRIKGAGHGGAPVHWWLSIPRGGSSTHATQIGPSGAANRMAVNSAHRVPACFRIA